MDEVSLLVNLLTTTWSSSATTLQSAGAITSDHVGTPNIIDIRTMDKNKGVRYDLSSKDVIIVFEESQNITYPTVHYDVRNETHTFTLHIRCIHDERAGTDTSFGMDRLESLYLIARHALESKRRGYTSSDGSKFNQVFVGSRTESNDRNKRIFGYKINIETKRFSLSVP
tara:strand:- start:433 stop:942 length:510 start_codon:yes stop_codon:yes gene_type:complete